jgi:diketogulonate reductase-like aldo/keto reductase
MNFDSIGIGTYKIKPQEEMDNLLTTAFKCGYKMIDTAEIYRNQKYIGQFFKSHPEYDRNKIWITSKVNFDNVKNKRYEQIIKSIDKTFIDLNTSYVDLYLIHCPIEDMNIIVWKILREYQKEGKIRHIGISNFTLEKIKTFINEIGEEESKHIFCNQIEYNPFLNRKDLINFCQEKNIKVVAYGSLNKKNNIVEEIALRLNKTAEQVLLKWTLQNNVHIIPSSQNPKFIIDNISLDFEISEKEMDVLNNLNDDTCVYKKYL